MILDIAIGIIIACVVLSMGRGVVALALIGAAFYFGLGPVVLLIAVAIGALWLVLTVGVFITDKYEREAIMLSHPKLFARWLRPTADYERREPRF